MEAESEGGIVVVGDLQAIGRDAYRDAIDLEVAAYLETKLFADVVEEVRTALTKKCREEHPIERILAKIEFETMAVVEDDDGLYQTLLDGFRDLLRRGLDRAEADVRVRLTFPKP